MIERVFGVTYHPDHVWKILHRLGWSCQKPELQAREKNDEAAQRWRERDWPRIKGGARRKASIAFIDETGFMLQPTRRRTWAPRGRTPVLRAWDRHDRLSVIGAITVSPRHRRLSEYFQIQPRNVQAEDLVWFVEQLHRRLPRKLIVIWDRSGPHRRAAKLLLAKHADWLTIEWLPPYCPELNPEEHCWKHAKYDDLANYIPKDLDTLYEAVGTSLQQQRNNARLLRSYFDYAQLKL